MPVPGLPPPSRRVSPIPLIGGKDKVLPVAGYSGEAGAGQIAGIASAVGMAILGAASSYVAYQKKKLCFKIQGGTDPESGKNYEGNRGQPRQNAGGNPLSVLTNLLRTS
ncbi:unnamed protein product [Boreogadus saida]